MDMDSYAINEDFVLDIYGAEIEQLAEDEICVTLKGHQRNRSLNLLNFETTAVGESQFHIGLNTSDGGISCYFHPSPRQGPSVIWVWAAGFEPAGGVYTNLSHHLTARGISSLRLNCRVPHALEHCILDTLAGIAFLKRKELTPIILVGHSFAGAVVIDAGALRSDVCAVVALSSQIYGADLIDKVAPRPLLLVHGDADQILPHRCSELLYDWAGGPKQLVVLPGAGHGLWECQDEVRELLEGWLIERLTPY